MYKPKSEDCEPVVDPQKALFGRVQGYFTGIVALLTFIQFVAALVLAGDDSFSSNPYAKAAARAYAAMCGLSLIFAALAFASWSFCWVPRKKVYVPVYKTYWGKLYLLVVSAGPAVLSMLLAGSTDMTASVIGRLSSGHPGVNLLTWLSIIALAVTIVQLAVSHVWGYVRREAERNPEDSLRIPKRRSFAWVFQVVMVVLFATMFVITTGFLAYLYRAMLEAPVGGDTPTDADTNRVALQPLFKIVKALQMFNYLTIVCLLLTLGVFCVIGCVVGIQERRLSGGAAVVIKSLRAVLSTIILTTAAGGYAYVLQTVSYTSHLQSLANAQLLTSGSFAKPGDTLMIWQTLNFWTFFGYVVVIHVLAFSHD